LNIQQGAARESTWTTDRLHI